MKVRKICSSLILTAFLAALLFAVPGEAALKKEYKLNCNLTENTIWGQGTARFVKLVQERTDGKINIKPYYSAQLLSGKQTNELLMLRNGTIDFSYAGPANWTTQLPAMNLFTLPWFIASTGNTQKAMEAIAHGKAGKMLEDIAAKAGVTVIGWGYNAPRQLHANKPIRTPEDMKGLKIRFVSSPLYKDTLEALGTNGVNINWSEAVTAYQQGLVDAGENPYNTIIPYRVYEFHKYMTEWNYTCAAMFFVVNTGVWNSFDAETQKILRECADEAGVYTGMLNQLGFDDGTAYKWLEERNLLPEDQNMIPHDPRKLLEDNGVTIIKLSPEEIMAFRKATKGAFDKHVKLVGEDVVQAAIEDMKAAGLTFEELKD
jgi:TRAP-type C4-dicarboxylate transport system substrate-binding protein